MIWLKIISDCLPCFEKCKRNWNCFRLSDLSRVFFGLWYVAGVTSHGHDHFLSLNPMRSATEIWHPLIEYKSGIGKANLFGH